MAENDKNVGKRIVYMDQYTIINTQHGIINNLVQQINEESDLDKAIAKARSIRGHAAVILKALHSIKRGEKAFDWLKTFEEEMKGSKDKE